MSLTVEQRAHDLAISHINRSLDIQTENNKKDALAKGEKLQTVSISETYYSLYKNFLEKLSEMDF